MASSQNAAEQVDAEMPALEEVEEIGSGEEFTAVKNKVICKLHWLLMQKE
jgi:hypothetical protein